jgi:hypothetical protein
METKDFLGQVARAVSRTVRLTVRARVGRFRAWPPQDLLIDEPLSLAEERTNRLRRIYEKCAINMWDGPQVFRDAVSRHGGIQLDRERRVALAHLITPLMWGELGAWIVSAELAERLDDADARMAASSQVFDEARHFYVLRDYLALLHVPVPRLDPYFALGVRSLLADKDLVVKLLSMQLLAEGSAQSIFGFLADAQVEPVLTELLPYIERDEARHVGLGVLHLPQLLAELTPAQALRVADRVYAIGDLLGLSQVGAIRHYRALGLDPRELFRRADGMLTGLAEKLGTIPGTDKPYFRTDDPARPDYHEKLDLLMPRLGDARSTRSRWLLRLITSGARAIDAVGSAA